MSVQQEKFIEIANAIRAKTGSTELIKPLSFVTEIDNVYNAGQAKGFESGHEEGYNAGYSMGEQLGKQQGIEEGKQAEKQTFWNVLQKGGSEANYYYAFAYNKFTDENYEPQFDIRCSEGTTPGQNLFYNSSNITDTKVAIYTNSKNATSCFQNATGLVTIYKFVVQKTTTLSSTFVGCTNLENLTIDGVIGQNIGVHSCTKLSHDSLISIADHLFDYATTPDGNTYTLTMGTTNQEKLTDSEKAIITQKGWTIA